MGHSITVTLPAEMEQAVRELSKKDGLSPHEVICKAIKQHVFHRQFRSLRERMAANTTDQDVFDRIS
jgi:predicted transcriptional regulator